MLTENKYWKAQMKLINGLGFILGPHAASGLLSWTKVGSVGAVVPEPPTQHLCLELLLSSSSPFLFMSGVCSSRSGYFKGPGLCRRAFPVPCLDRFGGSAVSSFRKRGQRGFWPCDWGESCLFLCLGFFLTSPWYLTKQDAMWLHALLPLTSYDKLLNLSLPRFFT